MRDETLHVLFFQGRGRAREIKGLSADQLCDPAPRPLPHDDLQVAPLPNGLCHPLRPKVRRPDTLQYAIAPEQLPEMLTSD